MGREAKKEWKNPKIAGIKDGGVRGYEQLSL